jgi:cytoskeletal protein CcmA (bactofilin family)
MAFNDYGKGKEAAALTAFIDQGSEFSGKLSFKDTVRIDGRFEGEIKSENTLIVGETGHVFAQIKSGDVVVSGEVKGDIIASGRVTLHKTARVSGNVHAAKLAMEEGAELNGQVAMSAAAGSARGEDKFASEKGPSERVLKMRESAASSAAATPKA